MRVINLTFSQGSTLGKRSCVVTQFFNLVNISKKEKGFRTTKYAPVNLLTLSVVIFRQKASMV